MNTQNKIVNFLRASTIVIVCLPFGSCKKYLDEKPVKSQVVISALSDAQALLDAYTQINQNSPELLEGLADNYYLLTANWNTKSLNVRMNYIWDPNSTDYNNWLQTYDKPIYIANNVLDALPNIKISDNDRNAYNAIRGSALFVRAFAFYEIAQLYCPPYSNSASTDLGIVLRLNSNINIPSTRATVQQTYDQIIADLKEAATLLPDNVSNSTRPNKSAAYGALARTYLSMRDYINAGMYANLFLAKTNLLIDYNSISPTANPVFPPFNKEYVYYNRPFLYTSIFSALGAKVDSILYQSYDANDLRKTLFFSLNSDGTHGFRGSYEGQAGIFGSTPIDGICTDELYLIRAESNARAGNKDAALADLNALLMKRWKNTVPFPTITATDGNDALNKILVERRKELLYRCVRWTDIRRLNLEGANITLKRIINGTSYILPPNDLRYALLIPQEVLNLVNLPQNPR